MAFNRNFPIALQIGCEKDKVKINSIQFLLNKCNLHDHELMKYWKSPLPSPFCVYPFSCVTKLLTWRIQKGIGLRFAPLGSSLKTKVVPERPWVGWVKHLGFSRFTDHRRPWRGTGHNQQTNVKHKKGCNKNTRRGYF